MNSRNILDVHTHYVPHGWPDISAQAGRGAPWLDIGTAREARIMLGSKEFRRIDSRCWDPQIRLADMDRDGVSKQVVSPTPVFFHYARSGRDAEEIARVFNDRALAITEPSGGRLIPFCQVPLQDPDAACRELDRCLANGHQGVEIGNHVGDNDLDSAGVETFLSHCAALGVPVFVHPWDMAESVRTERWMAQWLVSMPAETHLSIVSMILGGAFDRLDRRLKICFAHGGGSFGFWLGRMENAWHERHEVVGTSAYPPSHYLDRFFVDSVVFHEAALRLLVEIHGVDRIVVGSDYPYPLGENPVGAVVAQATFLDEKSRTAIFRGNAEKFLGLR